MSEKVYNASAQHIIISVNKCINGPGPMIHWLVVGRANACLGVWKNNGKPKTNTSAWEKYVFELWCGTSWRRAVLPRNGDAKSYTAHKLPRHARDLVKNIPINHYAKLSQKSIDHKTFATCLSLLITKYLLK